MRKITEEAVMAFRNSYSFKKDNTTVTSNDITCMFLHGNLIAKRENGRVLVSHCGWETNTTKERLNGLLSSMGRPTIYQRDFVWYRDIDGVKTEFESGWNKA